MEDKGQSLMHTENIQIKEGKIDQLEDKKKKREGHENLKIPRAKENLFFFLYAVPFIAVTCTFRNWKPVSLSPLHLFCSSPYPRSL